MVTRQVGPRVAQRREDWIWLARDLDANGVLSLQGERVGFDTEVSVDGVALPDDPVLEGRARASSPPQASLSLRLSGQVAGCSVEDPAQALHHRALGLQLPPEPVPPGATWRDDATVVGLARLLPADVPVRAEASTRLDSIESHELGWRARLLHTGFVRTREGAPSLHITGHSLWDTDPGTLTRRTLEARPVPDAVGLGWLRVEVERLRIESPGLD